MGEIQRLLKESAGTKTNANTEGFQVVFNDFIIKAVDNTLYVYHSDKSIKTSFTLYGIENLDVLFEKLKCRYENNQRSIFMTNGYNIIIDFIGMEISCDFNIMRFQIGQIIMDKIYEVLYYYLILVAAI